jgi:hypothetical protein
MHCFHVNIIHFLQSLYITHIKTSLQLLFFCIHLFFTVPSETMDRGFTVFDIKYGRKSHGKFLGSKLPQSIILFYETQRVHYSFHKSLQLDPILSQLNLIHTLIHHFFKPILVLSSHLCQGLPSVLFLPVCISHLLHVCFMFHPSQSLISSTYC